MTALLLFSMSGAYPQGQSGWVYLENSPERLTGLLDLDDIVRGGCGPAPERAVGRLFAAPSETSSVVGTIRWREEGDRWCGLVVERTGGRTERLPALESGYEIPAAIVYERRGPWFRVRLNDGAAWIRRVRTEDFLPYPEYLREQLAHTMQTWDGTLRATPGPSGNVVPLSEEWKALLDRQLSIEYLGSRRVGGELWIHIRLPSEVPCDQKIEGVTTATGWISAYHSDRSPSVWFSSRGC